MPVVIVRPATVEDARSLAVVHIASWRAAYPGLVPQEYLDQLDVARRQAGWQRWVEQARPPAVTLVAHDEAGEMLGLVSVSPSRDPDTGPLGEVQAVYLRPEFWGQGVGRLLMAAGLRRLAEAGYRRAILWVLEPNQRARRFYEAGGWRPDGTTRTDSTRGFPLTEIRYRRSVVET